MLQEYKRLEVQYNLLVNGQKQSELREALQHLLRWAWKRNKNLEEQAAQLHMLVGWSQLVEVCIKVLLPLSLVLVLLVGFVFQLC